MKPKAYVSKGGILFKDQPPEPLEVTPLYEMPKPLTDEEIEKVFDNTFKVRDFEEAFLKFARAIEERHGIK